MITGAGSGRALMRLPHRSWRSRLRLEPRYPPGVGDHVTRQVHWSDRGDEPALVLLHGLGGDADFWTAETSEWSKDFRVVALDLRGSGATPATDGGHTIADLADDVRASSSR